MNKQENTLTAAHIYLGKRKQKSTGELKLSDCEHSHRGTSRHVSIQLCLCNSCVICVFYRIFSQCVVLRLEPIQKLWVSSPPRRSNSCLSSAPHASKKVKTWRTALRVLHRNSVPNFIQHKHNVFNVTLKFRGNFLRRDEVIPEPQKTVKLFSQAD